MQSAEFSDLLTGVQGLLAMIKRRRALFKADAAANGYPAATDEELVYWTALYYNPGENDGLAQLIKYKSKRKLSDWIKRGEYPHAQKVLRNYRMLKAMNVF
ncbi:MAG: hypothetical protein EHM21_06450 [Chloroflexi bacterium]|nr:MAG: hypothetical protein EHM21_06450 [Chloroflexota bacterium]